MIHYSRHRLGAAAIAACVAFAAPAIAQDERVFDIPAGPLEGALALFAVQSEHQLLFATEMVAGRETSGVSGRLKVTDALDRLLAGSSLSWRQTRPGVIVLRRAGPTPSAEVLFPPAAVDDIIVTGSLLRQSGELASPVVQIDRDALDASGRGTVADLLTALPQNYAGSGSPSAKLTLADRSGSNSVVSTGVNLRGLGPDATLVLINGRRLAGTGFRAEFADVSALPSAAVERVDILLDGASALYGSDAVAGVVNIIMKRQFDGQETRLRASSASGGAEDLQIAHTAGKAWSSGAALLSVEYQTVNGLSSLDRDYTATGDLRPFGGSDWRTLFSAPGNIVAYDPARGGYVSRYAIRPGASGVAETPADFAAGSSNLEANGLGVDLLPEIERASLYGRFRQSLGDRVDLSGDVRFSHRDYGFTSFPYVTLLDVGAANPHFVSPDGSTAHQIAYSFSGDLGGTRQEGSSESLGLTLGADLDLGRDWSLSTYVAHAEERGESWNRNQAHAGFLSEALGNVADNPDTAFSAARDGYFNPFGAGAANNPAVLAFVGQGYSGALDRSQSQTVNALFEGPLWRLPAGDIRVAIGAQYRKERFATRSETFLSSVTPTRLVTPARSRDVSALFGEARVPLVTQGDRPGLHRLELSFAGRIEAYEDQGSTSNPKLGIVWSPTQPLTLRASYGTSFRAPALPEMFDPERGAPTFVTDSAGARVLAIYRYGGNVDLEPEEAETLTAGFDYRPQNGARLAVSYFDTQFTDRISQPLAASLANALTDPALAPFVTRVDPSNDAADLALVEGFRANPGYALTAFPATSYGLILDARWVNAAAVTVRGVDLTASYPLTIGGHRVDLDASASQLLDYETQLTAAARPTDRLGQVGYPAELRARAGASWTSGAWGASLHWSHVAGATDATGQGIDAWNTADAQLRWAPDVGPLREIDIALSVQNLFDADPPFYNSSTGYGFDPGQADMLGRVVALQMTKRW